jgi:hypothetical protein
MKLPGSMKKNFEQITKSFFLALPNLGGEIPFKRGRFVTPTFRMKFLCQARSLLGCILENLA